MSLRSKDLVINLSTGICTLCTSQRTNPLTNVVDFCPTASATIGMTNVVDPRLDALRTQLRATLGR